MLKQFLCILVFVFSLSSPEAISHSRVNGACPVATDCIVATSECEDNNNNKHNQLPSGLRQPFATVGVQCVELPMALLEIRVKYVYVLQ